MSNLYLDFSLISTGSNYVSMLIKGVLVSWGENCRLLVVDSLLWTVIKYYIINC